MSTNHIPEKFRAERPERKATAINRALLKIGHGLYYFTRELPFQVVEAVAARPFRYAIPGWLENAVFYQIYPQSFKDSDGDGVGDIRGIIEKLDYLSDLGVDCLWLNPIYDSPFQDAGYDIRDFYKVAPRYGTNEDLVELFEKAGKRNIRVVLDLVAGHSSDECAWFVESANEDVRDDQDMYIWTERKLGREPFFFVPSEFKRTGYYRKNFYDCQPALNYGYGVRLPFNKFEQDINDPGPRHTREQLKDVIAFWMEKGASGFRVDLAESLVKRDPGYRKTIELWNDVRDWMVDRWPDSVLISEWSFPEASIKAGFQVDFVLPTTFRGVPELIFNETGTFPVGHCYFDKQGKGSAQTFIAHFLDQYEKTRGQGLISFPTANHDYQRPACGSRTDVDELKALMLFCMTWSDLPTIYYGDEIGMRYLEDLGNIEGSALNKFMNRAGQRTPMQWNRSAAAGFSDADPENLYLPVDDVAREDFPNVAEQAEDPDSLLRFTKALIALKKSSKAFSHRGRLEVCHGAGRRQYPLAYQRTFQDECWLVVINPTAQAQSFTWPQAKNAVSECVIGDGVRVSPDGLVACDPVSHAVYRIG